MSLAELQALEERYLMQTYRRAPVEFVRGEGPLLWDSEGREYLDFLAGISVCSIGHCHPAVVEAVREQAGRLMHVSNLFYTEPMVALAKRLSDSSLGGRVFFSNSGAEANECAQARPRAGRRLPGDRQLRARLPRPHLRGALGDAQAGRERGARADAPGLSLGPAERRRRPARRGL
jgi:acetylornithine/N-succinyldiaminopimelate aminotransferase